MKSRLLLGVSLLSASGCVAPPEPDYGRALPEGAAALIPLGPDEHRPSLANEWVHRSDLVPALERSIEWTSSDHARQFFPMEGITHEHALASLVRFRELLDESNNGSDFDRRIGEEFTFYKSAGWDARGGGVLFTAYCTPILRGRVLPDTQYRFPLYGLPTDLVKGEHGEILGRATEAGIEPYPTREAIEAYGLLKGRGLELVWLSDPIDAFIAHVNGSAFIETPEGELLRYGYAGKNGRPYRSLGGELVNDGELAAEQLSLASIRRWATENPEKVGGYLNRNESYVFFTPIEGNPRGSLNVEVAAERSLATDKRLFPRAALVFVDTRLPSPSGASGVFERIMLDQDTGGAIRTAGRADIYLGIGPEAELRAGRTQAEGQLYYMFLSPLGRARATGTAAP